MAWRWSDQNNFGLKSVIRDPFCLESLIRGNLGLESLTSVHIRLESLIRGNFGLESLIRRKFGSDLNLGRNRLNKLGSTQYLLHHIWTLNNLSNVVKISIFFEDLEKPIESEPRGDSIKRIVGVSNVLVLAT